MCAGEVSGGREADGTKACPGTQVAVLPSHSGRDGTEAEAGGPEVNTQMSQESQPAASEPKTPNRPSQLLTRPQSPGESWQPAQNSPQRPGGRNGVYLKGLCVSLQTCDHPHSPWSKAGPPYKIPHKTVRGRQEHKGKHPRAKPSDHWHTQVKRAVILMRHE